MQELHVYTSGSPPLLGVFLASDMGYRTSVQTALAYMYFQQAFIIAHWPRKTEWIVNLKENNHGKIIKGHVLYQASERQLQHVCTCAHDTSLFIIKSRIESAPFWSCKMKQCWWLDQIQLMNHGACATCNACKTNHLPFRQIGMQWNWISRIEDILRIVFIGTCVRKAIDVLWFLRRLPRRNTTACDMLNFS